MAEVTVTATRITDDDMTPDLIARREEMAGSAAFQRLEKEFGGTATQDPAAAPKPAVEPGNAPAPEAPDDGAFGLGAMGRIAKDFARGMTEAPGQIVGGVRDAAQETIDLWLGLGNWLEKKVPITPGKDAGTAEIQLPEIVGEADSTTGKMVRGVSQFIAGFAGAGKLAAFKALAPATRGGKVLKAMGQGAVADFTVMDPHEKGLSDLIESAPALSNPVTRFMASDPDDNEAEKRFKKAAEGLGLGAATEGLVMSLRALRAARIARNKERIDDPSIPAPQTRPEDVAAIVGDPAKPLFTKQPKIDEATGATRAASDDDEVFINFARIQAPDDIQKLINEMAQSQKGDIRASQRGVRTWEQTKLSATQVNAWDELMQRAPAGTLNAEQSLAARQLWVTSATKLSEVARLATTNPSSANLTAFRQMLSAHYAIQKEVIGARTETARALNAWKIPAGAEGQFARQLDDMLESNGGAKLTEDLAKKVAALSEAGMAREVEKLVEGGTLAKTRAALSQVWINSLLSNPATHVVNTASNWSVIGQQIAERRVAASISNALGTEGGVAVGESLAMLGGITAGFRDGMRAAWKMAKAGETTFGMTKLDTAHMDRPGALSPEAWAVSSDTPMGQALSVVDFTTRLPGRALATSDEFFKSIGYRMEMHAQATRMAQQEVAEGAIKAEDVKRRVGEIIANPPESITIEAADAALYNTFTNRPADTLKKIADAWQNVPVLGVLTLPFKNTPMNILTYAAERSPTAPLVRQWRDDVAAGGAKGDIALARMATGSMLMLAMMDAAMSGNITGKGPSRPQERQNWMREGNQEYSVRVGDRWYSYSRADPVGLTIGMAADIAEAVVNGDKKMEQGGATYNVTEEAVISSMLAVAKNVTSKTYMSGVAEFLDAISDPDRHGERYFQRIAGSFVPAGVAVATRQNDPYMRTAGTVIEAMQRRSPFHSEDLPMYRDLWGRPVDYRSGYGALYDIFSPVYTKKYNPEPIDAEMQRLEFFPSMPEKKVNFNGVGIDLEEYPHAYSRYVELAGNEAKHPAWGVGAKDLLNAIVSGGHPLSQVYKLYSDGKDGGKADMIQQLLSQFREQAKKQVLEEFPELQAEYESKRKPYGNRLDPALFGQ